MDNTFHYNEIHKRSQIFPGSISVTECNLISAIEQQNWVSITTPSMEGKGENRITRIGLLSQHIH